MNTSDTRNDSESTYFSFLFPHLYVLLTTFESKEAIAHAAGYLHVRMAAYLDSGAWWEMYVFGEEAVIERVEVKCGDKLLHSVRIGCGHADGVIIEERVIVVVVDDSGEGNVGGRGLPLFMRGLCNR